MPEVEEEEEEEEEEGSKPDRPPGKHSQRKRVLYDGDYVSKKARRGSFTDFESYTQVDQSGTHDLSAMTHTSPPEAPKPSSPIGGRRNGSGANGREKVFTCNICNRSFGFKHVLKNHKRTHTAEKPFECKKCHKRFTGDHHLKTHMRLHSLRQHLRVHTGKRPVFPRKSTKGDCSNSEDTGEDGSISESGFGNLETVHAPGDGPSNYCPVPFPRTFQAKR